jgi:hypothetical protein
MALGSGLGGDGKGLGGLITGLDAGVGVTGEGKG